MLKGLSFRDVNIWRSVVLPLGVVGVALAVAIIGAVIVGSGGRHRLHQPVCR